MSNQIKCDRKACSAQVEVDPLRYGTLPAGWSSIQASLVDKAKLKMVQSVVAAGGAIADHGAGAAASAVIQPYMHEVFSDGVPVKVVQYHLCDKCTNIFHGLLGDINATEHAQPLTLHTDLEPM